MIFLKCKTCHTKVTSILEFPLSERTWNHYSALCEKDFVAESQYFHDPEGNFVINLRDQRNLNYHHDRSRLTGCCGPSEANEANLVCQCGAEIGREIADCITPRYVRVDVQTVLEVQDKWRFFERIKIIDRQDPFNPNLLTLYSLIQYGNDSDIQRFADQNFN